MVDHRECMKLNAEQSARIGELNERIRELEDELEAERAVHRAWLARFGELPQSDAAAKL